MKIKSRPGRVWRSKVVGNIGARKAIRWGSSEEKVQKHRDRVPEAYRQIIIKPRRRIVLGYDQSMVTALQGTCMDKRKV